MLITPRLILRFLASALVLFSRRVSWPLLISIQMPTVPVVSRREPALKSEFAVVRGCSLHSDFWLQANLNSREQARTAPNKSGTIKSGAQRFYSRTLHLSHDLTSGLILPALFLLPNLSSPFPRDYGGNFAGAQIAAKQQESKPMETTNEGGAPPQSSARNAQITTPDTAQNQGVDSNEDVQPPPEPVAGIEPKTTIKRLKGARTVVLSKGLSSVKIEHEGSRQGRKPWRVTWVENGKECSEMHDSYDDAYTAAEAKLTQLADGQRTLTREELKALFAFKLQVESFNKRLTASNRTLDQVVSDAIAAAETLPGWTASQMAQFIVENHGVKNPMLVEDVVAKFIKYLESGYKKKYSSRYIDYAEVAFGRFATAFKRRYLHLIDESEALDFITNYRVKPKKQIDKERADKDGLVLASPKTKNTVHNLLNLLFDHAKDILGALPRRLETAIGMLTAPGYEVPTPEIYTYAEIVALYSLLPDLECVLFVSLQLYAGLRPCECMRMRKKDIKRDAQGKLTFIFVRQEVGKKSPVTGRKKIRTRKAPITPPLAALLNVMQFEDGRLFASVDMEKRVKRAAKAGNFVWKHDSLRHSFISYRLADLQDRAQVAYEAGHGVDVQIEHYEGLIEEPLDVPNYWAFSVPLDLPLTLNPEIVGRKFVLAYKAAKAQAENVIPMPSVG